MAVSPGLRDEIRRLARETDLSAAEIARRLGVRYERVRLDVREVRRQQRVTSAEHAPARMAQRILALLGAELERVEKAQHGRLDLDRLDKIAKTLRTVEPIRPKSERERPTGLRALVDGRGLDVNGADE